MKSKQLENETMIDNCFVFGFNHTNTSEENRSKVALTESLTKELFAAVSKSEITSLVVLNTCNRTECYGVGNSQHLIDVFFNLMHLDADFRNHYMLHTGNTAVQYMFSVASGLYSQIIGDLEILGQFKNACKYSKAIQFVDGYFERLVNTCLQAAKEVRSETKITNGTVSLSYAAIKLLHKLGFNNQSAERVLMIGTGSFGKNIVRDVSVFLPKAKVTVTNRTLEKAQFVAQTYNATTLLFDSFQDSIQDFDVVIAAITNESGDYLINPNLFSDNKKRIFIDLSLPKVINPEVGTNSNGQFYSIDDAASIINETLHQRREHLPLAEKIISKYSTEFVNWSKLYEKRATISAWKKVLENSVNYCPVLSTLEETEKQQLVKKGLSEFSVFLKNNPELPNDVEFVVNHFRQNHSQLLSVYREKAIAQHSYEA